MSAAALEALTAGLAPSSARQVVLRVKSLLSYGHRLGYLQFNAGVIKVGAAAQCVAKQIVSEVEIGLLVRAADTKRDRLLIEVGYAGGLRVTELVRLTWGDVIPREGRPAQCPGQGRHGAPGAAARGRQPLSARATWRRRSM